MSEESATDEIVVADRDDFFARMIAPGAMFLVVLVIWTVIRMIWKEVDDRRTLVVIGSLVSLMLFFIVPIVMKVKTIHSVVKAVAALLLFVPYVFGCYLVFYEGLWRLRLLESGFSFGLVFATIVYTVGGFGVVKATYNISEFGRSISSGTVRVE